MLFFMFLPFFSLAALPLLPYSTATFFVWRNTFVFMSLLLYMINIIIAEWFIRIAANATIYCTVVSMVVKRISALMQFMLKQTHKKPINKVQLKNNLSFRCVIPLICLKCLISLNSALSLKKQTRTYWESTYKPIWKMVWSQLTNVAYTTKKRQRCI